VAYCAGMNLWTELERTARRTPDAPATRAASGERCWSEVHGAALELAAQLAAHGVGPGDRVALSEYNSPTFLDLTFAVARLGAVLVPLNLRLSTRELKAILVDSAPKLWIANEELRAAPVAVSAALPSAPQLLWIDADGRIAGPATAAELPPLPTVDLAHLYYTSGTTGRPKGVMLSHANICLHAHAAIEELALRADDVWGHIAPMFHLADAWATIAITAAGGTHAFVPTFEALRTLRDLERFGIRLTNLIPTMVGRLLAEREALAPEQRPTHALRLLLTGGAPIAPQLIRDVKAAFGCDYVQTYGMTETSPYLTLGLLDERLAQLPLEERERLQAKTGRPFRTVELEVVDEAGASVPADDATIGEIRVRGATVFSGYWQRPEETAQAIRVGWLYTGDLATLDEYGFVNIVDRKKDMIVTGGENVYSTEVEHTLHEHAAIVETAVFGQPDEDWGEVVCAAVVLKRDARVAPEELIAFCRERLAGYKCPKRVYLLDDLPKTGSGKIQKRVLREQFAPDNESPD